MAQTVQTVNINLDHLENKVNIVSNKVDAVYNSVQNLTSQTSQINQNVEQVSSDLAQLKKEFEQMLIDQRRTAALQQAATELIRVRQEIEQNFSGYKVVRETMLGVLQATDVALVKKTTISRVSEELMLSTPKYWLAPCLVAVSAWISNDRELSERAIAEAVKRDEERTALAMALICRRNNRVDTCYEWLSIYFSKQSAANFSEGSFTYLNAYLNGVFGHDEKHICDDYIEKWMREIQEDGAVKEEDQIKQWNRYCQGFTVNIDAMMPQLSVAREYDSIKEYLGRIAAVGSIAEEFGGIQSAEIDQERLKKNIDNTLVSLISRYDAEEEPLRREERYLSAVRYYEGDQEAARRAILQADQKRKERTIDLISQMTNVIVKKEDKASPSEKKTAVSFLSPYIRKGFDRYITEKKTDFPNEITFQIGDWTGHSNGYNEAELCAVYEQSMNLERQAKLDSTAKDLAKAKIPKASIGLGVVGLIFLVTIPPLGILLLAGAGLHWFTTKQKSQRADVMMQNINTEYNNRIAFGKQQIHLISEQWRNAKEIVRNFENRPPVNIVA